MSGLEKILDRLPYADGSGRSRIVMGAIITVGIIAIHGGGVGQLFPGIGLKEILTSPSLAASLVLVIYAMGSLVEIMGDVFLIRAASGVFWALKLPSRKIENPIRWNQGKARKLGQLLQYLMWLYAAGFVAYYYAFRGTLGYIDYKISVDNLLSNSAHKFYQSLPNKVKDGLDRPVGDSAEYAWKYLCDQLTKENDRQWAQRIIRRAKDVAGITTASLLLAIYWSATQVGVFGLFGSSITNIQDLPKPLKLEVTTFLQLFEEGSKNEIQRNLKGMMSSSPLYLEVEARRVRTTNDFHYFSANFEDFLNENKQPGPQKNKEALEILEEQHTSVVTKVKDWEDKILTKQRSSNRVFIIFSIFGLLLYHGFFVTLRNGIIGTLEILSLQNNLGPNPPIPSPNTTDS